MKQSLIEILLTNSVLLAGCLGEGEADIFHGDDIATPVHVDDFVLMDENGHYYSFSQL